MPEAGVGQQLDKLERKRQLARARRLRNRADGYADDGRYTEAIECLQEVVLICPADERAFLQMGSIYQETRKYESSLAAMRKAIAINPMRRSAHESAIQSLVDLRRFPDAIAGCTKLLEIHPNSLFARDSLCTAYFQMGELEKSLRTLRELIQLDPQNPNYFFKSGIILQQRGGLAEAVKAFEAVISMAPENTQLFHDAMSAIDTIDEQQMGAIMTLLSDDRIFEIKFLRSPTIVLERGFILSRFGLNRLRNIVKSMHQEPPQSSLMHESTTRYYN